MLKYKELIYIVRNHLICSPLLIILLIRGILWRKLGIGRKLVNYSFHLPRRSKLINILEVEFETLKRFKQATFSQVQAFDDLALKLSLEKKRNFEYLVENKAFDLGDIEKRWSALQLSWLLVLVRNKKLNQSEAFYIVNQVIKYLQSPAKLSDKRAFTLSELVVNILKIYFFFGSEKYLNDEILVFVRDSQRYVLENLEVYANSSNVSLNHTNNHIISNLRMLLWVGVLASDEVLVQFSQKTLRKYWSQLFDDKCLDEGSLHYFIISQDIIYDINLASQSEQYEVGTDLSEAIIQFTSGKLGTFPAIGDISPDPDLSFLWPDFVKRFRSSTLKQGLFNFSDYLFYFEKELSITAHFRSTWKPIQHSHNDFGAPIVNIGSLPVLIDLGRKNYIVKYGKDSNLSPLDHNCPSIGGLMSSPRIMRDVFPKYFLTQKFEPLKEEDVEKILMQYSLKGTDVVYAFKCENTATKIFRGHWIRLVCLKKPIVQLVILDLVVTKIKCDVELRLNTGLSGRLVQDAITFQVNGETNLPIKRNVMRTSIYGYEESCDSLGVLSTKRKNHVIITRIKA